MGADVSYYVLDNTNRLRSIVRWLIIEKDLVTYDGRWTNHPETSLYIDMMQFMYYRNETAKYIHYLITDNLKIKKLCCWIHPIGFIGIPTQHYIA